MSKKAACNKAALDRFSEAVRGWFNHAFEAPTAVQEKAWESIEAGQHTLVVAPTGSGKTLAAFLFALNALMQSEKPKEKGARVVYISPLKALGADVQHNLQGPLCGIAERLQATGGRAPSIRSAMRTGDTTAAQRRSLVSNPPDILITTPESLYLMLTSQARNTLRFVQTLIVDEVHALAGNKRGAHLALSLERLDQLLEHPALRIGLSATVRPCEEVARFLGGAHPVKVVQDQAAPTFNVKVVVPVKDMTAVGPPPEKHIIAGEAWRSDRALNSIMLGQDNSKQSLGTHSGSASLWPFIEQSLLKEVLSHRSTIIFVNSRGLCEKLTARLNELYVKEQAHTQGLVPTEKTYEQEVSSPSVHNFPSSAGSTTNMVQPFDHPIAKAHHGSVSKEKRLQVEHELKTGALRCVVATSSLELGIDMGSIDLVLQVAPPPSVASGLQRIGRANHQVGGCSAGSIYPRTRSEIIDAAVISENMRTGGIEAISLVRNPLDVLAQQTVAAVAMDQLHADEWFATVKRTASFSTLTRTAFEGVLSMLAGSYAAADLAEFSPRLVWDREKGTLRPRPNAQRLAVGGAGTIPDRGMFRVVLPEGNAKEGRRRIGELDEEMVYESRVGDIIALGTSSWRIREITRDRVIVEPAFGRSARLPFWHGEGVGRPAETGRLRGAFLRDLEGLITQAASLRGEMVGPDAGLYPPISNRLSKAGLNEHAQHNLVALLRDQARATTVVPTDRTLVLERFEDETGAWRLILHSPYGRRVHEPWALAVQTRVERQLHFDPQAMAVDDGIVVRIPMGEYAFSDTALFLFDPDELVRLASERVGQTALFSARFRECAARALLMTPTQPGKRVPLWQQRLKAGQLLEVARTQKDFPLLLETARECLQDVYDLDALHVLAQDIQDGRIKVIEAHTSVASPFAVPLLFGYVGQHLYEGDLPHAERQASLLSIDPALLGELLGHSNMLTLLDKQVVSEVESQLGRTADGWRVQGGEGVVDLLRFLGPLSTYEVALRLESGKNDATESSCEPVNDAADTVAGSSYSGKVSAAQFLLEQLQNEKRIFRAQVGAQMRWASVEDASLLHDALGTALPSWVSKHPAFQATPYRASPLDALVGRFARTHGPFSEDEAAHLFGIGRLTVQESLERLFCAGKVVKGQFGENEGEKSWVDAQVLKRLRSGSLARARAQLKPVSADIYQHYVLDIQQVAPLGSAARESDSVMRVLSQFEGVFLAAQSWEKDILPARISHYQPTMLDELIASGQVMWVGAKPQKPLGSDYLGSKASPVQGSHGLVAFFPSDSPFAPLRADGQDAAFECEDMPEAPSLEFSLIQVLSIGYGLFFQQVLEAVRRRLEPRRVSEQSVVEALWALVWQGRVTNDTFAPLRMDAKASSKVAHEYPSTRAYRHRTRSSRRRVAETHLQSGLDASSALTGRWSLIAPSSTNDTLRAIDLVDSLLDRYGLIASDLVILSGVVGGMSTLRPVLRSMQASGELLYGSFVEGLGPGQYAPRETVESLRGYSEAQASGHSLFSDKNGPEPLVVIAANDPACLFGAGLPWPEVVWEEGSEPSEMKLATPARRDGALVVLLGGRAVLFAAKNRRSLVAFTRDENELERAIHALLDHLILERQRTPKLNQSTRIIVQQFNGRPILSTRFANCLAHAGFVRMPDGMHFYINPFF